MTTETETTETTKQPVTAMGVYGESAKIAKKVHAAMRKSGIHTLSVDTHILTCVYITNDVVCRESLHIDDSGDLLVHIPNLRTWEVRSAVRNSGHMVEAPQLHDVRAFLRIARAAFVAIRAQLDAAGQELEAAETGIKTDGHDLEFAR